MSVLPEWAQSEIVVRAMRVNQPIPAGAQDGVISVEDQEQMSKHAMLRRAINTLRVAPVPLMLRKRKPGSGCQLDKRNQGEY
jgi:hypothetical protein